MGIGRYNRCHKEGNAYASPSLVWFLRGKKGVISIIALVLVNPKDGPGNIVS